MYEAVKDLFGNSGMGNAFETIAHKKLILSKQSFELTPLHEKYKRGVSTSRIPFDCASRVVHLRRIEDISVLPEDCYGLPVERNFPLVDAIVPPATLLQMTVCKEKHKGAVDRLDEIRRQLPEKNFSKHRIVFVVPPENVKSFKYQKDLGGINQFVLCPDPVVDGRKRKRKG